MTEEKIIELIKKHDVTVEHLENQKRDQRATRRWLITALVTALGTAGGGGGLAYYDSEDDDDVKTQVASHVAGYEEWREAAVQDIEELQRQQIKLREAVVRLQTIMEERHRGRVVHKRLEGVGGLLEDISPEPASRTRRVAVPKPERVQSMKAKLFEE